MAQAQEDKLQLEREDPAPVMYDLGVATIQNKRADRVYQLANPNDHMFGVATSLNLGWTCIDRSVDKERMVGGKPGNDSASHETWHGQILMWMPKKRFDAIQAAKDARRAEINKQIEAPGGVDGVQNLEGELAIQNPNKHRVS